jgi:hypothetical protein
MSQRLPTVMSTAALVVAVLGWTPIGEAARQAAFPANSVGTTQLQSNAVTSPKIRNGSVQAIDIQRRAITAAHVKPGSLVGSSFKAGQLPAGPKGDEGDKGDKGDKGAKGDPGAAGPPGATAYQVVTAASGALTQNAFTSVTATCPAGRKVLGGGAFINGVLNSGGSAHLITSRPTAGNTAWLATMANPSKISSNLSAYAVCAIVQ